jgi:hypothetical protein
MWLQARGVLLMPEHSAMQNVEPTARIMAVDAPAIIEPAPRRTILFPKE